MGLQVADDSGRLGLGATSGGKERALGYAAAAG